VDGNISTLRHIGCGISSGGSVLGNVSGGISSLADILGHIGCSVTGQISTLSDILRFLCKSSISTDINCLVSTNIGFNRMVGALVSGQVG